MCQEKIRRYFEAFNADDEEYFSPMIDNCGVYQWAVENIPSFECSDEELEEIYYYRWWTFRKHIKKTPKGYIFTEFRPDVPWAGPYNSINAPLGFHVREARWLRSRDKYLQDYLRFWLKEDGNVHSYSCWIGQSILDYCDACGDYSLAVELLDPLIEFYEQCEKTNLHDSGLFWSWDDRDAMEFSVSGNGLRPTLNSYMYANAMAIARIAAYAGRDNLKVRFLERAAVIKTGMQNLLWDKRDRFFKVLPLKSAQDKLEYQRPEEVPKVRNVMEEIGYIPWMFDIPEKGNNPAWRRLLSKEHFNAPFGPTTADIAHERFMFEHPHECLWNGPSWPFATSQTLVAAEHLLKRFPDNGYFTDDNYTELLKKYAGSHYRIREDGKKIHWIDENIHPFTGEWLSRSILKAQNWPADNGGYERGKDYNHSEFCDLIITGLCGITPGPDNELSIRPLARGIKWFSLRDVPYHNHFVSVEYNNEKQTSTLTIRIDGVDVYSGAVQKSLKIKLPSGGYGSEAFES